MAARLKVFTWSDGFHAFTVAAPSRPKALEAWGVDQDLFKTGLAHEIDEGADRNAALASPGAVISRGLSVDIGKAVTRKANPAAARARARAKLKGFEAELETLDGEQADALRALHDKAAALDAERRRLEADHDKARTILLAKVKAARAAV